MFIAYDLDVKNHQTALSVPGVDDGWLELDPVSSVGSSNLRICFAQRRPQALQRVFGPSGPWVFRLKSVWRHYIYDRLPSATQENLFAHTFGIHIVQFHGPSWAWRQKGHKHHWNLPVRAKQTFFFLVLSSGSSEFGMRVSPLQFALIRLLSWLAAEAFLSASSRRLEYWALQMWEQLQQGKEEVLTVARKTWHTWSS